jgi:membrane protein YdbS with pleckstrin-like domain
MGDASSLRVFHAGKNYFRLRLTTWAAAQLLALAAILFWLAVLIDVERMSWERQHAPAAPPPAGAAIKAPDEGKSADQKREEQVGLAIKTAAERIATAAKNKAPVQTLAGFKQFLVELAVLLPAWAFPVIWLVKIVSFVFYLVQIPVTYAVRRLDYEMRWYMVTDRSLRLRSGVWKVLESTMSFANVQQVTMTQNPIQRLLGLGDVRVQSAGGGGVAKHEQGGEDMHLGLFHCVTNAAEIRDLILARLRRYRESGLGDPEEHSTSDATPVAAAITAPAGANDPVLAARELLAEARALRATLS